MYKTNANRKDNITYQAESDFNHFGQEDQFDSLSCFIECPRIQLPFECQQSGILSLPFRVLLILAAWTFSLQDGKEETKDNLSSIVPV